MAHTLPGLPGGGQGAVLLPDQRQEGSAPPTARLGVRQHRDGASPRRCGGRWARTALHLSSLPGERGRAGLQGCQTHTAPGFSQGPRDLKSLRTAFVAGYVEFIPTKVHVLELNAPSCPSCCLLAGRCTAGLAAAPPRCPGAAGPARGHSGWQTGSQGPSATAQKSSRLKVPVGGCRRGQHPLPRAELPCHRS